MVKCLYQNNIKITLKMSMSGMEFPVLQVDGPDYLKWGWLPFRRVIPVFEGDP